MENSIEEETSVSKSFLDKFITRYLKQTCRQTTDNK